MTTPIVAIVGRPNVGKSTLFNRLMGQRDAITAEEPGTTRDRLIAQMEWEGQAFSVVDTAGLALEPKGSLEEAVRNQVHLAIREADLIIFMTDIVDGTTPADSDVADALRRSGKSVVLVANKADNRRRELGLADFHGLGLGEPLPLSAHHNLGIGDLLDKVVALLPPMAPEAPTEGMRLAIVGRPNSGKSLLVNTLLGEERVVVSDIPGTTRDSIDMVLSYGGETLTLIDTAGIRRRGRVQVGIEKFSVFRAIRAIERADIAVLLLDAAELASAQDTHIAGYVLDSFKGLIIVVNKWDLAKDLEMTEKECRYLIQSRFKFAPFAPILFASGLTGAGLPDLMKTAGEVYDSCRSRVSTGMLNRIIERAAGENLPRLVGRRRLHLLYATQSGASPPTFVFFVNDPKLLHFTYRRYLENRLRDEFDFTGTPLRFIFKSRGE